MKIKNIISPAAALAVVSLVVSAALVVTYNITKPDPNKIDDAVLEAVRQLIGDNADKADVDTSEFSEYNLKYVFKSTENNGLKAYNLSSKGYGGEVEIVVAVNSDNTVKGVRITKMEETPGLGAKIENPEFYEQYNGKSGNLSVVKGESQSFDEISAITGATISSKAVTESVNNALRINSEVNIDNE